MSTVQQSLEEVQALRDQKALRFMTKLYDEVVSILERDLPRRIFVTRGRNIDFRYGRVVGEIQRMRNAGLSASSSLPNMGRGQIKTDLHIKSLGVTIEPQDFISSYYANQVRGHTLVVAFHSAPNRHGLEWGGRSGQFRNTSRPNRNVIEFPIPNDIASSHETDVYMDKRDFIAFIKSRQFRRTFNHEAKHYIQQLTGTLNAQTAQNDGTPEGYMNMQVEIESRYFEYIGRVIALIRRMYRRGMDLDLALRQMNTFDKFMRLDRKVANWLFDKLTPRNRREIENRLREFWHELVDEFKDATDMEDMYNRVRNLATEEPYSDRYLEIRESNIFEDFLLTEGIVRIGSYSVHENPSLRAIPNLLKRDEFGNLRFLYDTDLNDLYVWDSETPFIHGTVAEKLGVLLEHSIRGYISYKGYEDVKTPLNIRDDLEIVIDVEKRFTNHRFINRMASTIKGTVQWDAFSFMD